MKQWNETILPAKTVSFSTVIPAPQLSSGNGAQGIWGRLNLRNVSMIGGLPTIIASSYSDSSNWFAFQFDGVKVWPTRIFNDGQNYYGALAYGGNGQIVLKDNPVSGGKGLFWTTTAYYYNWVDDFPIPGLPANVAYVASSVAYEMTAGICFAQGGVSCNNTSGPLLIPPTLSKSGKAAFIALPGAGCPSTNNYGIANYSLIGPDDSFTVADGSNNTTQPFLRQPDIDNLVFHEGKYNAVYIGGKMVACLVDNGQVSNNGTLLRIYSVGIANQAPGYNPCSGAIEFRLSLIYEKDIRDIAGYGSYYNCPAIWSDGAGTFGVSFSRSSYRSFIFFRFPGPVIQEVKGITTGGANALMFIPFLMYNGTVVSLNPSNSSGNTILSVSNSSIDMNVTIRYTPPTTANSVYAGSLTEMIGG